MSLCTACVVLQSVNDQCQCSFVVFISHSASLSACYIKVSPHIACANRHVVLPVCMCALTDLFTFPTVCLVHKHELSHMGRHFCVCVCGAGVRWSDRWQLGNGRISSF